MSISHSTGEAKLVEYTVSFLALHRLGVTTTDRALLFAVFIHAHVVHNLVTELVKDLLDTLLNVFTRDCRLISNLLSSLLDHGHLSRGELINVFGVTSSASVNEADITHGEHELSMFHQVNAEGVLKDE